MRLRGCIKRARPLAVFLVCLALPLTLSACNGRNAAPTLRTVVFPMGTESLEDTVTGTSLRAVTLRLRNTAPTRYTLIPPQAGAVACEGLAVAANRETTCSVKIRIAAGGASTISIDDETGRVLGTVALNG